MLPTVEGIYRNGRVELREKPAGVNEARVIVTFLPADSRRPTPPELAPQEPAELRGKLSAWEDDWNAPGMDAYDEL